MAHFSCFYPASRFPAGFFSPISLFFALLHVFRRVFSLISLVFALLLVFRRGFFSHFSCFYPASRFPMGFFRSFLLFLPCFSFSGGFFRSFLSFLPCFPFSDGVFSLISLVFALLLVFRRGFFVHFFLFYHASCFPAGFNPCRHPPSLPCLQQLPALQS